MAARRSRGRAGTRRRAGSKADQEFVSEAEEILERMRRDLADLGDQLAGRVEVDPELVNQLFRSAHSLKGLAGLFGHDPIHDLAHHLEDILDALRLGRVVLASGSLEILDRCVALFASLLETVGDVEAMTAAAGPVPALVTEMESLRSGSREDGDVLAELDLDPSLLRALTEYEEHRLRENLRRQRHIALVDATFEILAFEEGLGELTQAVREVGEVLSTLPAAGEAAESQIRFSLLVASDLDAGEMRARLEVRDASVREVSGGGGGSKAEPRAPLAPDREPATPGQDPEGAERESLKSISDTIRVDIRKLDELMNLVGELVIQRGALGELIARLCAESAAGRIGGDFTRLHKALDRKLRELQAAVLEVRMVPLRQVFEKVSRVVRRLRVELDKDVRLDLHGADTELDKLIVEELVDPLMHIVRNALDHAIETPDERRAAGKESEGCVRIEAFQRGNHVVVAVSDDGRGIDTDALRARAQERGLVAPGDELSEKETLDLVFAAGVSTRSEVSETSGRGVGMDVVRHNLTLLGGVVDVDSAPGRGTTISMTLPITLAIIQSLIVVAGGQRFAIPVTAIQETLLVDESDIQRSEDREMLNLRGEALLLRRLAKEFGMAPGSGDGKHFAVVIGMGDARIGLLVDRLDGQQDTVIKPIQGPVQTVRGISGATELGDQDPVLVLDVSALLADALGRREAS